jgi:hypothetical protein
VFTSNRAGGVNADFAMCYPVLFLLLNVKQVHPLWGEGQYRPRVVRHLTQVNRSLNNQSTEIKGVKVSAPDTLITIDTLYISINHHSVPSNSLTIYSKSVPSRYLQNI